MASAPRSVSARLNYSTPTDRRPVIVNGDFARNELFLEPVETTIWDADGFVEPPRLDVEGFARVRHGPEVGDLANSPEAIARYRESVPPLIKALTGADEVLMTQQNTVREQVLAGPQRIGRTPPVDFVHSDFSAPQGFEMVRPLYGQPSRADAVRTAILTVWKLLSPPPTNRPLAICDARSVMAEDFIPGDTCFPDFSLETAFFRYGPRHRWAYFPKLANDEVIVMKQGDSDPSYPRLVPHSAFVDNSCPPDAAPRVSIEARCLAVWYG